MKFSLRHQSRGLVYPYLAMTVFHMMRLFFRKVYLNNAKSVPTDRPVLLAGNHPTAFVDPCLFCTYLDPPVYNMTRGDVFKKPFFSKLMYSINMFPIYRLRDGYKSRHRNDEVFDYVVDLLRDRRLVSIFVEGEHHLEKHVLPAKKGIAHIAFAALEEGITDLEILPAGCNYQFGDRARDEVMFNIGKPILIADYQAQYEQNRDAAIDRLCDDVEAALKIVCLHVERKDDYSLAEQMLTLHRSLHPDPVLPPTVVHNNPRFAREKRICDRVNALPAGETFSLKEKADRYFNSLQQAGLDDMGLLNPHQADWKWLVVLVIGFVPFLVGTTINYPLRKCMYWVADKKVSDRAFYGSVLMGVRHLTTTVYFTLLVVIGFATLKPFWIGLSLLLPFLDWMSLVYLELWARWRNAWRAGRHPRKNELLQQRAAVLETFPDE